jgi:formyltetrahydrofolate synthetase
MDQTEVNELRNKYFVDGRDKEHEMATELITRMQAEKTFAEIYDNAVERYSELKAIVEELLTVSGIPMELIRKARGVLRDTSCDYCGKKPAVIEKKIWRNGSLQEGKYCSEACSDSAQMGAEG